MNKLVRLCSRTRQEAVQQSVVPGMLARKSLVQEAGSKQARDQADAGCKQAKT